jgi:hypothetical protein
MGFIAFLFRDKKFFFPLMAAAAIHLGGHFKLGTVAYNTTNFDVFTHLLLGFFARGIIKRLDDYTPFIGRIRERLGMVSPSLLALLFCLAHEGQEGAQGFIPLLSSQVYTTFANQVRDFTMNIIGIGGSCAIERFPYFFDIIRSWFRG